MNEKIKKLTGKNRAEYEQVAREIIDNGDVDLFKELVNQDDYLFDFVKQNVADRLSQACNKSNYKNLLKLMSVYSPSYEDFISSTLAAYADEDLTDEILTIFEHGSDDEKTYCAKYFSHIQDPLVLPILRKYAFGDNFALAQNCATALGVFMDSESYNIAIDMLHSDDDFEKFDGVNFLISYGDKNATDELIFAMKNSGLSENIAGQIPYLKDLSELIEIDTNSGLLILNNIINGLGEIIPLSCTLDFNLWEIFNMLINETQKPVTALILTNAKSKFNALTENDEYLFDEDKNTKNEVLEIKKLLDNYTADFSLIDVELRSDSDFVYTALELSQNINKIKHLLNSTDQTLILKAAETLKVLNAFDETARLTALDNLTDTNIKAVINTL